MQSFETARLTAACLFSSELSSLSEFGAPIKASEREFLGPVLGREAMRGDAAAKTVTADSASPSQSNNMTTASMTIICRASVHQPIRSYYAVTAMTLFQLLPGLIGNRLDQMRKAAKHAPAHR